jgi:hypothetical protein
MKDHASDRPRRAARLDPVPMFFGPTGPGPFALLGLEPAEIEPPRVFEALHARLAQLAKHPQSATPAGEEVSLALHAAAAQICDPSIRSVLLRTWHAQESGETSYDSEHVPLGEQAAAPIDVGIERDLHLAIGLSGGWNARAMERLAIACHAKGVDLADAVRAVQWAGQAGRVRSRPPKPAEKRQRLPTPRASGSAEKIALPERDKSSARVVPRDAIILIGIGGLGIVFLATAIILLTPAKRPALPISSSPPSAIASAPLNIASPEAGRSRSENDPSASNELEIGDPRAITLEISGAMQDLASDAVAAHTRFARAYDAFGKTWPMMSADEIAAVVSAIVDYCYGASRLDTPSAATITRPLHENLASGKSAVRAASAAASIAGRLLSERELPRAFLDQIESGATIGDGGSKVESSSSFRVGLERNMNSLGTAIASSAPASAEAWKGFLEVRDAALADRQPSRDIATLNVLEMLLRNTTIPPRDLVGSVGVLAPALSWRPSDELRMALAGWLEDATVPSELLTEITRAMVASSAPGVDSTMVLPAGSGPEARSNLRERLAQVWQGKTVTTEREDFAAWLRWAEILLYTETKSDAERLWTASRLSRATLAAEALRAGEAERAVQIMSADASTRPAGNPPALPALPKPDPASKALEYAGAGNSVQGRLEVLRQVQAANTRPDTLLADVLVTESARGTPAAIRDLARSELRKHAADPAIVLATLRLLPSVPETPENADWVSEVAGITGEWKKRPKWKEAAQIALLDRAIGLFPVSPDESNIDAAARELADSWFDRSGEAPASKEADARDAIDALEASLASATRSPRGAPAGLNVSEIRRRLAARTEIAPGPLERAVAKQAACVEWTALSVAHERPGDIGAVQQLLEQWNTTRRSATTSTEQLLEGERVIVRLQMLRVGGKVKAS